MHLCGMDYKYLHHTVVSVIVLAVLSQWDVAAHATGSIAIVSIQAAIRANSPMVVKCEAGFPNPRRALKPTKTR